MLIRTWLSSLALTNQTETVTQTLVIVVLHANDPRMPQKTLRRWPHPLHLHQRCCNFSSTKMFTIVFPVKNEINYEHNHVRGLNSTW